MTPSETNCPLSACTPKEEVRGNPIICPGKQSLTTEQIGASEPNRGVRTYNMVVTAYCNCHKCTGKHPGDPGYGITASGVKTNSSTCAADWGKFAPGTKIYIPGVGYRIVQDTGGAIKGNRIDIWMPSHEAALQFGKRTLNIKIIN